MIKRKLIRTIITVIVMQMGTFHIFATFTRSAGLGLEEKTSWMISKQLPYIFENPAYVSDYRNNIYFEYINGVPVGGIFVPLPFSKSATLGLFSGSQVSSEVYNGSTFESLFHSGGTPQVDFTAVNVLNSFDISKINSPAANSLQYKNLEAILGFRSGSMSHGFSFSFGFAQDSITERTTIPDTAKASQVFDLWKSQIHIGYGLNYKKRITIFNDIDLSAKLIFPNLNNTYTRTDNNDNQIVASLKTNGALDASISARGHVKSSGNNDYFVHMGYAYLNRSTEATETDKISGTEKNATDTFSRQGQKFSLGVSNEIVLGKIISVLWGTQFELKTFTNKYDGEDTVAGTFASSPFNENANSFLMPLILGVRSNLTEKLNVSFALRHNIVNSDGNSVKTTETRNTPTSSTIDSATLNLNNSFLTAASNVSVAVAYQLSAFTLEWLLNAQVFQDGPYFISGKTNSFATSFAVTFSFDKI